MTPTPSTKINSLFANPAFYKRALLIALPVMAQALIQNLVSLIDNFMVSGLGDVKMSGVNISGQLLFVFMVFLNTLCMGDKKTFASGVVYVQSVNPFFDDKEIRAVWNDENSRWYFSVLDVVGVLNEQNDYAKNRNYWKYLKAK